MQKIKNRKFNLNKENQSHLLEVPNLFRMKKTLFSFDCEFAYHRDACVRYKAVSCDINTQERVQNHRERRLHGAGGKYDAFSEGNHI